MASFENWLVEKGYPPVHLRIDAANNDPSKKLIQGISGVGGDLFDNYADQTYLMQSTGILADLTGPARQYGFGPESTFESIRSNFMIDGRQWGYPASTSIALLLVNVEAFRDAGLGIPPRAWDIETFEEWGRRYVAANRLPGERQRRFFANSVERYELMRSLGLSIYNETLTACCLDDPRYIRVLEKVHQWIFRDHLLPGPEEESTFAVEGSGLGVSMALFARGNYAMLNLGRFALVRLRNYGRQDYSASFMPHFEYINCRVAGGTVGLYTKSEKKEHAYRFFEYLASDTHNRMIVETGDALPVNPDFLDSEEFLRPPEFPNEWRVHEAYAEAMKKHSISRSSSPFILPEIGRRVEVDTYRSFIADQISAAQAASLVQERINDEITRSLKERPSLMPEYERRVRIQERIEDLKRDGLPIPEAWLFNPFHRRYYQDMGSVREGDVVQ
ncbi:MAG: extracellular solute-binding protein [Opitutaceae bacterium]